MHIHFYRKFVLKEKGEGFTLILCEVNALSMPVGRTRKFLVA